jgi:hypothetical protein
MHYIYVYHLNQLQTGGVAPVAGSAGLLGGLSLVLYALLYQSGDALVDMAALTRQGDKEFFSVPIVLAFLFSLVHGTFTGRFWDVLGFRPAKG